MAVQEEPKEPHVTSVLPWVILYRVIRQEEDAFRSLCHQQQLQSPADEGAVPRGPASLSVSSHQCAWARAMEVSWMEAEAPSTRTAWRGWGCGPPCFTSSAGGERHAEWGPGASSHQPVLAGGLGGQDSGSTGQAHCAAV